MITTLLHSAPAPVVPLKEMKSHLRILHDTEDDLITSAVMAATRVAEQMTGRSISVNTYECAVHADELTEEVQLAHPPFVDVESITTTINDTEEIVAEETYKLDKRRGILKFKELPQLDEDEYLLINYKAGYTDLPLDLERALKLMAAKYYETRGDSSVKKGVVMDFTESQRVLFPYILFK
jgi:uncharacterized phiE125 gp8 family phage protein